MTGVPDIQPATVITFSDWPRQSINLLNYGTQKQYKILKLSFLIQDSNRAACQLDMSNLCAELLSCTVKYADMPYYYDCVLQGTPVQTEKAHNRYQLDVTLQSSYAYLPPVTVPLTSTSQSITAQGNLPSPAIVTLIPAQDIGSLTLTGFTKKPITVSNLHAGAPVTIDGEVCIVTEPDLDTIITATAGAGKWMFRKYSTPNMFSPDEIWIDRVPLNRIRISVVKYLQLSDIPTDTAYTQQLIADASDLVHNIGQDYIGHLKTGLYVASAKSITFKFLHDDGVNVLLNGVSVYSCGHVEDNGIVPGQSDGYPSITLDLPSGWSRLEFVWVQHFGGDGIWGITPTISSQVDQLNAYYARDANPTGMVNKFPDTDMWSFPAVQPGSNAISVDSAVCGVNISYKPKFM